MNTPPPFDRALELHDLDEAAMDYAERHGERGSVDYRAAWLTFRRRIRTTDDLRRLRLAARRRLAKSAADRGADAGARKPASPARPPDTPG